MELSDLARKPDTIELHSIEPWFIGHARSHKRAERSLERAGFEAWWPTARTTKHPALSKLPSKTRHKFRHRVIVEERPALGSYIFFRPMFGGDISRVHELDGMVSVVMFGEEPGVIHDFDVELMRLLEAKGAYDKAIVVERFLNNINRMISLTEIRITQESREIIPLDVYKSGPIYLRTGGRVVRLLSVGSIEVCPELTPPSALNAAVGVPRGFKNSPSIPVLE